MRTQVYCYFESDNDFNCAEERVMRALRRCQLALALVITLPALLLQSAWSQQSFDLGAANPTDILQKINNSMTFGDLKEVKPWLSHDLFEYIIGDLDSLQAVVTNLGPVKNAQVVARRQVTIKTYFEISMQHYDPPLPPGTQVASVGTKSFWLLGYDGEQNVIETLSFRRNVRFEDSNPFESYYIGRASDPKVMAAISAIKAPAQADLRSVDLLYTTTRAGFSEVRSENASFGRSRIRIPETHKMGHIELSDSNRGLLGYEEKLDRYKHFIINTASPLSLDDWGKVIRGSGRQEALIFVHGFNTTFNESLYRVAQVVWDLQYKGIPILFSWASWGGVDRYNAIGLTRSYIYDRDSAILARDAFLAVLRTLRGALGVKRIHVVAHSMGNFLLLNALEYEARNSASNRLSEVIMAAPDLDRAQFIQIVPKVRPITDGMTLYASSVDYALKASKVAARGTVRAGDVPDIGPVVLPNLDTIDVTAVGSEILGLNHDVFATNRSLVNDIGLTLEGRRPPGSRLREIWPVPDNPPPPQYWKFVQ
jgi:esterase/lipase superfamily enzyme